MSSLFSSLMAVGYVPPRLASPLAPRKSSPLNPLGRPPALSQSLTTTATDNRTHLSNLERLLQKPSLPPPYPTHDPDKDSDSPDSRGGGGGGGGGGIRSAILNALNLHSIFNAHRAAAEEMSPRSLTKLQRLLSDSSRPSPRNTIAARWQRYHGSNNWDGLLDPLDENLRRELLRYGDFVQAAYQAFFSTPAVRPDCNHTVTLSDRSYRVTKSLYATSSIELPNWVKNAAPWVAHRSSWIGFVAVCDNDREIARMGRRDIVIALRGTATSLEWAENFRAGLVGIDDDEAPPPPGRHAPKVECGFRTLYKTVGTSLPSLSSAVVGEVKRLMERYKGEELSITVTGHSLGAALAVLVGDELSQCAPVMPPVAVFSFGGPRVGNREFAQRIEERQVKVLRVVNAHDMVPRVPMAPPPGWLGFDGYVDVGRELRIDSRVSPYLRQDADPAYSHDLEAYLHLVDGFLGTHCPFRTNAKRGIAKLLSLKGLDAKRLYMSKVEDGDAQRAERAAGVGSRLPSPSHRTAESVS